MYIYSNMEERLLSLLETVLGKSKKTSGDNYAFSPFVNHYKPKLEINIKLNSNGDNRESIVGFLMKKVNQFVLYLESFKSIKRNMG